MAFMTPEEIKAVRLQGSKVVALEGLNKEVRIIKMGSAAQLAAQDLSAEVKAGKKKPADTFLFLLEHGLTDLNGTPHTAEDARVIFSLISQSALLKLVGDISGLIGAKVAVTEGPAEELTPAAKKD